MESSTALMDFTFEKFLRKVPEKLAQSSSRPLGTGNRRRGRCVKPGPLYEVEAGDTVEVVAIHSLECS